VNMALSGDELANWITDYTLGARPDTPTRDVIKKNWLTTSTAITNYLSLREFNGINAKLDNIFQYSSTFSGKKIFTDDVELRGASNKIGNVVAGNYSEFLDDGTLFFRGTSTVWQDIDFPIVIRTTGAGIPTLQALQGTIGVPQWEVGDNNTCEGQELIHAWKEGSEVQWHVHMITNNSNPLIPDTTDRHVKWQIEYFYVAPHGVATAATTVSADVLIPANTPHKTMIIDEIARFTPPVSIGSHVFAKLSRIPATGGLVAPSANPWCSMLQIHIECNSLGSREIITK